MRSRCCWRRSSRSSRTSRYTDQVETAGTAILAFSARVGDRALDGIDLLRFDDEGKVCEMAVYIRPLSGLNALAEAMRQKLTA